MESIFAPTAGNRWVDILGRRRYEGIGSLKRNITILWIEKPKISGRGEVFIQQSTLDLLIHI